MQIDRNNIKEELLKGNRVALSKCITLCESTKDSYRQFADELLTDVIKHTGKSVRIGITGVPGVGKSTFIESLGMHLIHKGKKVAVLAIDPSSSISHGSILGDKTRMEKLSIHPNAFIRPTASGNQLGGLAANTHDAIMFCEAAGFDVIIIETVGVGQSEVEVAHVSDFFLLLMLAGAGDELQGIKKGIIEMCDGMIINKADGDNVNKANVARSQYAKALHFFPKNNYNWSPKVLTVSALENNGIPQVWDMIQQYADITKDNGFFEIKRRNQRLRALDTALQQTFIQWIRRDSNVNELSLSLQSQISNNTITPNNAVRTILNKINIQVK